MKEIYKLLLIIMDVDVIILENCPITNPLTVHTYK